MVVTCFFLGGWEIYFLDVKKKQHNLFGGMFQKKGPIKISRS